MSKIQEIQTQIDLLKQQLADERNKCKHTRVIYKHNSNTGNYDPHEDCYWNDVTCIDCGDRFTFDSEDDPKNYTLRSEIGSEFKMCKDEYNTFLKVQKQLNSVGGG